MTIFDYIVVGILVVSAGVGAMRGLIREILSLVGLSSAIYTALAFAPTLNNLLLSSIKHDLTRSIISYGVLVLGVLLLSGLLVRWIRAIVSFAGLGSLDYLFGIVFGLIRGLVIILFVYFLAQFTPLTQEIWWVDALTLPYVDQLALTVKVYLPTFDNDWRI